MAAPTPEVDGYSDLVEIGRGGFARVYRAHQDRFKRSVALKVLSLADPDERTRDRFERECQAMGELSWHPHVVAVYDSGITDDGHLWLAMEFLEKGSLADGLSPESVVSWEGASQVGIEVCGALGAAHAAGTLHRDLKPENVLLGHFADAKLADFGIAAVDGGRRTTTGVASFTVAHVAPEILRGHRHDERTDIYGLASTLHTLMAGRPPFDLGADEPVATVMMRIIEAPPPRLGPPVPDDVADLVHAALAKDPADRPQSAAAFGEALQEIQRHHDLAVTPLRLSATPAPAAPIQAMTVSPSDAPATPADDRETIATDPHAVLAGGADTHPAPAADLDETITVADPSAAAVPSGPASPAAPPPASTPPAPPSAAAVAEPAPAAPAPPAVPVAGSGGGAAHRGGRRGLVIGAVVVALVLVVGAVVLLVSGGGGGGDAQAGTFQTAQFASSPSAVAVNAAGVWVTDSAETEVFRLDPASGDFITSTGIINFGTAIALSDDGAGWVIADDTRDMVRMDLATNEDTNEIDIGEDMTSLSTVGTDVWIAKGADGQPGDLVRFDAIALDSTAVIDLGTGPNQVSVTDDVVWVSSTTDNTVTRVDPDTNEITATIDLDAPPSAIAAVEDAVWVLSTESAKLTRIDPDTNEVVATVDLGDDSGPVAVAATTDAVWVVDNETDRVTRIDPATNEATDEIEVSHEPVEVAATDTDVWVANSGDGTLTHIDPAAFT